MSDPGDTAELAFGRVGPGRKSTERGRSNDTARFSIMFGCEVL